MYQKGRLKARLIDVYPALCSKFRYHFVWQAMRRKKLKSIGAGYVSFLIRHAFEFLDTIRECSCKAMFLAEDFRSDSLVRLFAIELLVGVLIFFNGNCRGANEHAIRFIFVGKAKLHRMIRRTADEAPEHIATLGIRGHHPVAEHEGRRASMVRNDAEGALVAAVGVFLLREVGKLADYVRKNVYGKNVGALIGGGNDALKSSSEIHVLFRKQCE